MHRDRVVARISRDEPHERIKGRREGRVIRILERAHDTIVGTLQRSRNFYYVVPDDPRIVHDIYVRSVNCLSNFQQSRHSLGDKVVVRLEAWESRHVNPEGEIIEVLGPATAPGIDMLSIIRKYHLPAEFPKRCFGTGEADSGDKLMPGNSTDAKICAKNSSSPSIPMTRAISTTQFTSRRSKAVGASAYTLLMSPPT